MKIEREELTWQERWNLYVEYHYENISVNDDALPSMLGFLLFSLRNWFSKNNRK